MTETVEGNQPVVEIPFGFQGKVFRSPMPFSQYDRFNQIWSSYLNLKIQTVLVLAGVEEMLIYSERNLLDFYKWNGIHQLHFPILHSTGRSK